MKNTFKFIDYNIRLINYKRINFFRKVRLSILNLLLSPISRFSNVSNSKEDLLVLRLDDKLGDSVTATGFLRELKRNNPNSRLIVLCGAGAFKIYSNLNFIDQNLVIKKGIFSTIKCLYALKLYRFKVIINTSHILTPQMMLLACFIKAQIKLTFLNSQVKIFSSFVEYKPNIDSVIVRYEKTLKLLGYLKNDLKYEIVLNEKDQQLATKLLSKYKQENKKIVILNSFAGAKLRNFCFETTKNIISHILSENSNLVIISIGNAGDQNILKNWQSLFSHPSWIVLNEVSDLMLNIALLEQSDLVITPDTAWVHIASALQKKLVAVYREDSEEKNSVIWAPYGTNFKQIYSDKDDINTVDIDLVAKKTTELLFS